MKLGEYLVSNNMVKQADLDKALDKQTESPGKKLGEVLLDMGLLTSEQLEAILLKILIVF